MQVRCAYSNVAFTVGGFSTLRLFDAINFRVNTSRDLPLETQITQSHALKELTEERAAGDTAPKNYRTSVHAAVPRDGRYSRVFSNFSSVEEKLRHRPCHPFLYVDPRSILMYAGEWANGRLAPVERRLLFIAALKATGLVHFQCPAEPSHGRIQRHMEAVLRLLAWRESAVVNIPVPEYIVNDSTKALKNLDFWLSEVDEARANWLARVNARDLKQSLMRQEATLLRLIRGPQPVVAYSNRIAQWALDASEAPSNIREYWTQIFNTRKQSEIIALHSASVDELLEHLLDNLDTASVYAQVAIAHVRKIKQVNAAGPAVMFLDMDDLDVRPLSAGEILAMQATEGEEHFYDDEVIDPTLTAADRRILAIRASHMPRKERATTDEIIRSAPTEKPVKENYSSHLEYLKARAAYEVAQTALKQREQYDAQKAKDAEQVARLLSNISDKQSGAHEAGNGDSHAE